ncbi:hypothetical protein OAS67_01555 [Alphaproteobacteria bacterium]|nr:hypothetical protein [Alphaproteobacteria bacterium]
MTGERLHHAPIIRRTNEFPPEIGWFANETQMVLNPDEGHLTEPNAGILTSST